MAKLAPGRYIAKADEDLTDAERQKRKDLTSKLRAAASEMIANRTSKCASTVLEYATIFSDIPIPSYRAAS